VVGRAGVTLRLTELLRRGARPGPRITEVICEHNSERPRVLELVTGGASVHRDVGDGVRLVRDVLDVQVVDESGHRCGRVGEVLLERDGGELYVTAVEIGVRPVLRRCHLGWIWGGAPTRLIPWGSLQPRPGRVHALISPPVPKRGRRYHRVLRARRRAPS
jgi:hypothetical protein